MIPLNRVTPEMCCDVAGFALTAAANNRRTGGARQYPALHGNESSAPASNGENLGHQRALGALPPRRVGAASGAEDRVHSSETTGGWAL